jgi:hypothetical protein
MMGLTGMSKGAVVTVGSTAGTAVGVDAAGVSVGETASNGAGVGSRVGVEVGAWLIDSGGMEVTTPATGVVASGMGGVDRQPIKIRVKLKRRMSFRIMKVCNVLQ